MTSKSLKLIDADLDQPILFRTTSGANCDSALTSGSLWLRSDSYYRQIEDKARNDISEGINSAKTTIALNIEIPNGPVVQIKGPGAIGQQIIPHYILSLHGTSISQDQIASFGGHSFGIRNIIKLSAEVLYRASLLLDCTGYRYGPVSYRYATLALSYSQFDSSAISLGGPPPIYLNPLNTDVLTKQPIAPFIEQDEWRIVIFTRGYLEDDPNAPLKLNVDPSYFYEYDAVQLAIPQ